MRLPIFFYLPACSLENPTYCGGASASITNIDQEEPITSASKQLTLEGARDIVREMELALIRLEGNVNPRLLAEVLLLDLPEI